MIRQVQPRLQPRPVAFVPREIRTMIRQHLAGQDEHVLHTVTLAERDYLSNDSTPEHSPPPWHWLVVTDRQLLLFQRTAGEPEVHTLLACPHGAILTVEVGSVLLLAWITIISAPACPVSLADADGPRPGREKSSIARRSTGEYRAQVRIEFPSASLPHVQAAMCDLIGAGPGVGVRHSDDGASHPRRASVLDELHPPFRSAVSALTADGESIAAVLFCPPTDRGRRRRALWLSQAPEEEPWCGVAVTDRRVLLLEQPAPLMAGGPRYGYTITQLAPDTISDVALLPTRTHVVELRLRIQLGTAVQAFRVELDDRHAIRWLAGVATLRETVQAALLRVTAEHRSFCDLTGLNGIVLTEPSHYALLLQQIKEHHYYLGQHGRASTLVEAARDWYVSLYSPVARQLTAWGVTGPLPKSTPADLYMRLCEYKWLASERLGADIGFELALQAFRYWVA